MTDTDESLGQDVKQESAHEFFGRDRHDSRLVAGSVVAPPKRNALAVKGEEPMIGDGDTVRIATEIADDLLGPTESGFGIDNPILAKQRSQESGEGLRLGQLLDGSCTDQPVVSMSASESGNKLRTEHLAESANGQEECVFGVNPPFSVGGDTAGRNDTVNVRMKQEVLAPRMQDAEETDLGTQMFGVACHGT